MMADYEVPLSGKRSDKGTWRVRRLNNDSRITRARITSKGITGFSNKHRDGLRLVLDRETAFTMLKRIQQAIEDNPQAKKFEVFSWCKLTDEDREGWF